MRNTLTQSVIIMKENTVSSAIMSASLTQIIYDAIDG
jgi:hypothetical protein